MEARMPDSFLEQKEDGSPWSTTGERPSVQRPSLSSNLPWMYRPEDAQTTVYPFFMVECSELLKTLLGEPIGHDRQTPPRRRRSSRSLPRGSHPLARRPGESAGAPELRPPSQEPPSAPG